MDGAESPGGGAAAGRGGQPLRARAFSQPAGALSQPVGALPGARRGPWDLGGAAGAGRPGVPEGGGRGHGGQDLCGTRARSLSHLGGLDETRPSLGVPGSPQTGLNPPSPRTTWELGNEADPWASPPHDRGGCDNGPVPEWQAARSPQRASLGPLSPPSSGVLTPALPPKPSCPALPRSLSRLHSLSRSRPISQMGTRRPGLR